MGHLNNNRLLHLFKQKHFLIKFLIISSLLNSNCVSHSSENVHFFFFPISHSLVEAPSHLPSLPPPHFDISCVFFNIRMKSYLSSKTLINFFSMQFIKHIKILLLDSGVTKCPMPLSPILLIMNSCILQYALILHCRTELRKGKIGIL